MSAVDGTPARVSRAAPWRRLAAHRGALLGATVLALVVAAAVLAPLLAPHDPYHQDLSRRLARPFWTGEALAGHPLGTDAFGRDYLSRLIYGARVSMLVAVSAVAISGTIGTVLGLLGGYAGGRTDLAVSFVIACRLSLPVILVAMVAAAFAGASLRTVVPVLGLLLWDRFAVVARTAAMAERAKDYVDSARSVGTPPWRLAVRHVLPNIAPALLVVATLEMAGAILLEAALSFLGLGVQPPVPSWGLMVSEGKDHMYGDPWLVALPGLAICLTVMAINRLGDGLRDILDPRRST